MEIDHEYPASYERTGELLSRLAAQHPSLVLGNIGHSILGRELYLARIGCGAGSSLFVGAHHGMEHITTLILLRFLDDVLTAQEHGTRLAGGFDIGHLLRHRTIWIVPQLNPDGVNIELGGEATAGPLAERLLRMNGEGRNFSSWQANARGVDLNHNYDAGFFRCKELERELGIYGGGPTRYGGEAPESEPETAALCTLTRYLMPRTALALHTQGEEIYWDYQGKAPNGAKMLADCFASVSGYRVATPDGIASYGGYKDWVIDALGIPAFTIECGVGKNPLPLTNFPEIYKKVLPILLTAATF